jgi:hypothetical protein
MWPSVTSTTRVGAETLISSSPSSLDTTKALRPPSSASAAATTSTYAASDTPITCRAAPAGLVSGPRKLKMVRTPSALRTGMTCFIAGWWSGANMNPKPSSSMQEAIASGARSMRAPSASSTSAEPHWLVLERFPCLATAQPAAAATRAAVVETLNVSAPPPVPAVSSRSSRRGLTGNASSRIVRARPTISPTVSPFVRSAMRKAAVCASDALPSMISRSTAAASSLPRSCPEASRSMAGVSRESGI